MFKNFDFIIAKLRNINVISYLFLLSLFYFIGYMIFSVHYIIDTNFILVCFFVACLNFLFVFDNLQSIIVDYINNEVSQILLRSLLFIFFSNLIVYFILLIQ